MFSKSKELLPVPPSVGTHRSRRHRVTLCYVTYLGTCIRTHVCTYVRAGRSRERSILTKGRAAREQEGERGGSRGGKGTRGGTAASEKGSHSGQLITRELTRRFQYHFFHWHRESAADSISDESLRAAPALPSSLGTVTNGSYGARPAIPENPNGRRRPVTGDSQLSPFISGFSRDEETAAKYTHEILRLFRGRSTDARQDGKTVISRSAFRETRVYLSFSVRLSLNSKYLI